MAVFGSTDASSTQGKGFSDDVQKLAADIHQIKHDLASLAKDTSAAAQSGAAVATEQLKHGFETVKNKGAEAAESVSQTMAKHPVASVGIALGVGFLVGMIFCRPRN